MDIAHFRSGAVRYLVVLRAFDHHWYITAPNELLAKRVLAAMNFVKVFGQQCAETLIDI